MAVALEALTGAPSAGQTAPPAGEPWQVHSLAEDAGLIGQTIFSIDFTAKGELWLAASGGLYFSDGYRWERFGKEDGLPSDYVRCVEWTLDGLWIGTDQGACYYDGERFDTELTRGRLAGPSVRRIRVDSEGTVWFACDRWPDPSLTECGLTRWKDGAWTSWTDDDGLPSSYVSDIVETSRGETFVLTREGFAELTADGFEPVLPDVGGERGPAEYVWDLVELPSGELLGVTRTARYRRPPGGAWEIETGRLGAGTPKLTARDGRYHISTTTEAKLKILVRGEGGENHGWIELLTHDLGPGAYCEFLATAPDGSLWAVGRNLVLRCEQGPSEWTKLADMPPPRGLDSLGRVWCADGQRLHLWDGGDVRTLDGGRAPVLVRDDGTVWTGHERGLARWHPLEGDRVELFPLPPLENGAPRTVDRFRGGSSAPLWAADRSVLETWNLVHFDGESWVAYPRPPMRAEERIADIQLLPGARGEERLVYLVHGVPDPGEHRLIAWDGRTAEVDEIEPRLTLHNSPALAVGNDGSLWMGGLFGLQTCAAFGEAWVDVESVPGQEVHTGVLRQDGVWWAYSDLTGGSSGIGHLLPDGSWRHFDEPPLYAVHSAPDGTIYFECRHGLCVIPSGDDATPRHLPAPPGARPERMVAGADGEYWLGDRGGLLHFRPDGVEPETLLVQEPQAPLTGEAIHLVLTGAEHFEQRSDPRTFLVSHRVDGGPWSSWSRLDDGRLTLDPLSAGTHLFEARVMDHAGEVDPTPLARELLVRATPYQERAWFLPAVAAIALALVGLSFLALRSRGRIALLNRGLESEVRLRTEALVSSEARYRGLFAHSRDAILLTDEELVVVDANQAAERLFGEALVQLVGRPLGDLFHSTEEAAEFEAVLTRRGAVDNAEWRLTGAEGSVRNVRVTASERQEHGRRTGYLALLRDVTDQKGIEDRLRQTQKMEALGRLAAGIAHDFNNFLVVIQGTAEFLALSAGDDPQLQADVDTLLGAAERAGLLTQELALLGRSKTSEPTLLDLNEALRGSEQWLRRLAGDDVELVTTLAPGLHNVRIDPTQLHQVLSNLTANARDAMPDGGVLRIETSEVQFGSDDYRERGAPGPGPFVRLRVLDRGVGMSDETRNHVFEPFYTTKEQSGGQGLGLSSVYSIVEQSAGFITVASREGEGTAFDLFFPVHEAEPARRKPREEPPATAVLEGDQRILLVEDEEDVRKLVTSVLERWGYRVESAANAEEALELTSGRVHDFDLVVTDVILTGKSGPELVLALRRRRPDLPALFMSGYAQLSAKHIELIAQSGGLLPKPFAPRKLLARVREALGARAEVS